jgi:hypothetical protein
VLPQTRLERHDLDLLAREGRSLREDRVDQWPFTERLLTTIDGVEKGQPRGPMDSAIPRRIASQTGPSAPNARSPASVSASTLRRPSWGSRCRTTMPASTRRSAN